MKNPGYIDANAALEGWNGLELKGGNRNKLNVLGRHRKIQTIKGNDYITYLGQLISVKQAIKLENKKKKKT